MSLIKNYLICFFLREHSRAHHGHSHAHGHVHAPPSSIASVAWMVIMGDGLHNFTDGMAIGEFIRALMCIYCQLSSQWIGAGLLTLLRNKLLLAADISVPITYKASILVHKYIIYLGNSPLPAIWKPFCFFENPFSACVLQLGDLLKFWCSEKNKLIQWKTTSSINYTTKNVTILSYLLEKKCKKILTNSIFKIDNILQKHT